VPAAETPQEQHGVIRFDSERREEFQSKIIAEL